VGWGLGPLCGGVLELPEELGRVVVAEVAGGEGGDEDDGLEEGCTLDVEGGDDDGRGSGAGGRERLEELAAGEVGALEEAEDHEARGEENAADAEETGVGEPAEGAEEAEREEAKDVGADDDGSAGDGYAAEGGDAGCDGEVVEEVANDDGVDQAGGPRLEDYDDVRQPCGTCSDGFRPRLPEKTNSMVIKKGLGNELLTCSFWPRSYDKSEQ
jgi:hypothetical protein